MVNTTKIPAEKWLATARQALLDEGINGVKVDRIAKRLGVSRGGFYHHFANRQDLLSQLLKDWIRNNAFLPASDTEPSAETAADHLKKLVEHHISEIHFSPAFEMAIREWGRIDVKVGRHIEKVDESRIRSLAKLFRLIGYVDDEAAIRARILYLHQMGYYSLGLHQRETKQARRAVASLYMQILCGPEFAVE